MLPPQHSLRARAPRCAAPADPRPRPCCLGSRSRDEFAVVVGRAFGIQGFGVLYLDHAGFLGLRVDGGLLNYGNENVQVPLSSAVRRVLVDVNTTKDLALLDIGVEASAPAGRRCRHREVIQRLRSLGAGRSAMRVWRTTDLIDRTTRPTIRIATTLWDKDAIMETTSAIDAVVVNDGSPAADGQRTVLVGGFAHAGARGISKVEVQVDDGPWEEAQLRPALSDLTWVLWRYEWPFQAGEHTFAVRARDGSGALQEVESSPPYPDGATGIHRKTG